MLEPTLCEKCAAAFKLVSEDQVPLIEHDEFAEQVYSGLTVFALGALLGIVIGVIQD